MVALVLGIVFIVFAVYAVLPLNIGLGWLNDMLIVVRGALPVLAFLIGIMAVFIGLADLKDRAETRKEKDRAPTK